MEALSPESKHKDHSQRSEIIRTLDFNHLLQHQKIHEVNCKKFPFFRKKVRNVVREYISLIWWGKIGLSEKAKEDSYITLKRFLNKLKNPAEGLICFFQTRKSLTSIKKLTRYNRSMDVYPSELTSVMHTKSHGTVMVFEAVSNEGLATPSSFQKALKITLPFTLGTRNNF